MKETTEILRQKILLEKQRKQLQERVKKVTDRQHNVETWEKKLKTLSDQLAVEKRQLNEQKEVQDYQQQQIHEHWNQIHHWNQYLTTKEEEIRKREECLQGLATSYETYLKNLQREAQTHKEHLRGPLLPPGSDKKRIREAWIRFHKNKIAVLQKQSS